MVGVTESFRFQFSTKRQQLVVQGQEILTADKASLRISAIADYRIADVRRYHEESDQPIQVLYTAVQMALRQRFSVETVDHILEHKTSFRGDLTEAVQETAGALGLRVEKVDVRDFTLGGDLRRVYAGVLQSQKEALALVEKARGEASALRTLANATRLFDSHPHLFQLRYLKALEATGTSGQGNTLVLGSPEEWIRSSQAGDAKERS
ncbi:MAG: SPFH domain-containing protein [Verrucomicrobiota bacterium]